jgi:S1-C subfamily serine protease
MVLLINKSWSWIQDGNRYEGLVDTPNQGSWRVTFDGVTGTDNFRGLRSLVSKDFVNALAMDRKGKTATFRVGGRVLGTYRLDDSAAAIRDVVHCLQANPKPVARTEPRKEQPQGSSGTGFFVADKYVVTNQHVLRGCKEIYVAYPNFKPEPAYLAGDDEINDLAVLRTDMSNNGIATLRYGARLGEPIASFGFPLPGMLADEGNFTLGNVTSIAGLGGDTRLFQLSAPLQSGNSGGPIMDSTGAVLGVAKAVLQKADANDTLPQNVNFAIASPIVVNFLAVKGIKWSQHVGTDKLEPEKLAELAKKFTVRVICH